MRFSSIIYKNFIYNLNKYISFYFVNSLIVTMLYIYSSLIFNENMDEALGNTILRETLIIAFVGLVIFSIVFITYSNRSFLKNRGKEFGTYLTLGMTTKDLGRLIILENLAIMLISIITGLATGILFSKLFYMVLNKVLITTEVLFSFSSKSLMLSIGIFVVIFMLNMIFNVVYIRNISVINILKAKNKKNVGRSFFTLGVIALGMFGISIVLLPKILFQEIFKDNKFVLAICIITTIVAPYFIIGSILGVIKNFLKRFKESYNKHILLLSGLSHRFLEYKNMIYLVTVLMAGGMFFVGFTYSAYMSTREMIERDNPYDFMFVESNKYNKVNEEEIQNLIKKEIKEYKTLEYLLVTEIQKSEKMLYRNSEALVISEENFNKISNETINVEKGEGVYIRTYNEKIEYKYPETDFLDFSEKDTFEIRENLNDDFTINKDLYEKIKKGKSSISLNKISVKDGVKFVNTSNHLYSSAMVVNNEDYKKLKEGISQNKMEKIHVINTDKKIESFNKVKAYLKEKNGLKEEAWTNFNGVLYGKYPPGEDYEIEKKMPVSTEETVIMAMEANGINFFVMLFIGGLFIIASGTILYYKVLHDIEEERERVESLRRVGALDEEIKKTISKELKIIFFVPMILGGSLGLYYLFLLLSNNDVKNLILKEVWVVAIVGIVMQIIIYKISKKKYIREVF